MTKRIGYYWEEGHNLDFLPWAFDGGRPASTAVDSTQGWAITTNYRTFYEVDFWSTTDADGFGDSGFSFIQKLTASTEQIIAHFFGDSTFSQINLINGSTRCFFFINATGGDVGSYGSIPFYIDVNNVREVKFPVGGGLEVAGKYISTTGSTVAALPAAPVVGMRSYVTNALAPAFGANVVGGGAVTIPVFYDGTNWIVG